MVLHGARHSYAARVLDALLAAGAPGYQGRLDVTPDVRIPLHLLGTRCATRRALWGLAKLIGHASPATTVCSYTHLLDRLVNDYVAPSVLRHVDGKGLEGVINLDAMARLAVERKQRLDSSPTSALRLGSLIRFARLLSRGVSVSRAAAAFDLDVPTASLLNLALEWCFKTSARRKDRDLPLPILMATVTEGQWAGLIDYVDQPRDRSDIVWIKNPTPQEIASLFGPQRHLVLWREEHYQWAGALIDYIQLPKGKLKLYATSQETESQKKWVMQYRLESLRELEASPLQLDTVKTDGGTSIVVGRSVLVLAEGRDHPIGNRILLMIFAVCWFLAGQK